MNNIDDGKYIVVVLMLTAFKQLYPLFSLQSITNKNRKKVTIHLIISITNGIFEKIVRYLNI